MTTDGKPTKMYWPVLRLLAVVGVVSFLLYALLRENHTVNTADRPTPSQIGGSDFIRGASVDRYQRTPEGLYDTHSQKVPESATLDDCPT